MFAMTTQPSEQRVSTSSSNLDALHEWLLLGADEKAWSVIQLTQDHPVRTVLEIGSGTGAILERLDQAGFAEQYFAVEPSAELCRYMVERRAISRLVEADNSTIRDSNLARERYDLCIVSHVLEHLDDPAVLLADALSLADMVIVEVPLEGNPLGDARAALRTKVSGIGRLNNAAGHIQFFSRADAHALVGWCGGEILASRLYLPAAQMRRAMATGSGPRRAYARTIWTLAQIAGHERWARWYHGHYAVLVCRRGMTPGQDRTNWNSAYFGATPINDVQSGGNAQDGQTAHPAGRGQ